MRSLLFVVLWSLVIPHVSGQSTDLVKNQGIISDLHRNNVGKIRFTSIDLLPEDLKESDFISQTDLSNKTSLFFHIFMDNSITNYVHLLSPNLALSDTYQHGNLQFRFYLDGVLIYQENIHPGAGLPPKKDHETVLSRPFLRYPGRAGWWSEYLWERFKNNGGAKALTEGNHRLKLEIRPYVTSPDLKIGDLIASGELALNVKIPRIDTTAIRLNPIKPYAGLEVSKAAYDQAKIKLLKANIDEAVFRNITSVAVIKNGKILIEEYFNGADRNSLHDTRSVGKSFASTMAGIAIGEGWLRDENVLLKEFYALEKFANNSDEKRNTPVKDLLTMSSVFAGNDNSDSSPGNEENMYPTDNWVKFALDLPADTLNLKGQWHYFTAGVVVLGDILNQKVPGGLEKYAHEKLFSPLGITRYQWQHTPQGVANTAGGLQMNTLDYAKYGQLYKNQGKWNGRQVVPCPWIEKTFSKQKAIPGRENEFYGYLFWNKTYQIDGKSYETYYCTGNGGNKIFIFKDHPLVIVVTAIAYGAGYAHPQVDKMMTEYILPAVAEKD